MQSNDFLYNSLTDLELLLFVKDKNKEAFNEIYQRFYEFGFELAYSRSGNRKLAQEIVENVFILLWRDTNLDVKNDLQAYIARAIEFHLDLSFKALKNARKSATNPVQEITGYNLAKKVSKKDELKN